MVNSSVGKALDLLSLFLEQPEIGVTDAARRLGVDKSTVSRLMATLAAKRFVAADPVTRRYRLGVRTLHLAAVLYGQLDLRRLALPVMQRLRDLTEETVSLQTRVGDMRVCIEQVPSRHAVRRVVEVGQPLPLHAGSSGKLLLAAMSDSEIDALLERVRAGTFTPRSPGAEALRREIARIRASGVAISVGERVAGVSGISVAVRNYRGEVVAGLAVTGPSSRWTLARMARFRDALVRGAAEISEALGYRPAGTGDLRRRAAGAARASSIVSDTHRRTERG